MTEQAVNIHTYRHQSGTEAAIGDLAAWLARQTDQAIISTTLILLNSLKRQASLAQIAENTAHWEAAVRAGR